MIGDYHALSAGNTRIIPQYNPDPYFMTEYGPVVTHGHNVPRTVTVSGETQSACGGSCSVRRPAVMVTPPLPETDANRAVPVRVLKAIGRMLGAL